MTTIVKSKLIQGNLATESILNGALHLLDTARGVLVPTSVLESMTLKDFVNEVTQQNAPLTETVEETKTNENPLISNIDNVIKDTINKPVNVVDQPNEVYGAPKENVDLEATPVKLTNEPIVGPNIEEINKLRAVIAEATNKLDKLQDQLDELNQMLQYTLDNSKEEKEIEVQEGMKM